MRRSPPFPAPRLATALALLTALVGLAPVTLPAQSAPFAIPPGRLDSATVLSIMQTMDFVFSDDVPRAAGMMAALWERRDDVPRGMWPDIAYTLAAARGERPVTVARFRDVAVMRQSNDYKVGLMRLLIAIGEYSEVLDSVRTWRPAANEPPRPLREEMEATIAHLRGDVPTMLRNARAMRASPGWQHSTASYNLLLPALARAGEVRTLAPLVDTALAQLPRGFRVDPVVYYSNYGNLLAQYDQPALARKAWERALFVLDSLMPAARQRGEAGLDSVRISRGRLMLMLGRYAEAAELLEAPSRRLDDRERTRLGWLGVAYARRGDTASARRIDRALASDTIFELRSSTTTARAMIAEALGEVDRAVSLLLDRRRHIDLRALPNNHLLYATIRHPRIVEWMRGR
jgi:tetratricopeptide (TPR) repeat protein